MRDTRRTPTRTPVRSPGRTLGRTLGDLALALVNATLILVALCLWLGWMVLSEVRGITAGLNAAVALANPVTAELAAVRAEVAGLRADLAALPEGVGSGAELAALRDRAVQMDARFAGAAAQFDALAADPGLLVDRAVDRAALQIRSGLAACTPAGA
jgi:hypothetical protein